MYSYVFSPVLFFILFCHSGAVDPVEISLERGELYNIDERQAENLKFSDAEDINRFYSEIKDPNRHYGSQWIAMLDDHGHAKFSVVENQRSYIFEPSEKETEEGVKLIQYTSENPDGVILNLKDKENVTFDGSRPTKIIVHGWLAHTNTSMVQAIKEAYLEYKDVNVIGCDWRTFSDKYTYPFSAKATGSVGRYLGTVIDNLVENYGASYSDFHIVGHSLGAHVAGWAGNSTKEKIGRITGLDPALPGFTYALKRLTKLDADFVDVIHTCCGVLGMSVPLGHVDFYPNGGSPFQPGCRLQAPIAKETCSHSRSHEYFAESINKQSEFTAVRCANWDHFQSNSCENQQVLMGEHVSKDVTGIFYLTTNQHNPFSKGEDGIVYKPDTK